MDLIRKEAKQLYVNNEPTLDCFGREVHDMARNLYFIDYLTSHYLHNYQICKTEDLQAEQLLLLLLYTTFVKRIFHKLMCSNALICKLEHRIGYVFTCTQINFCKI